MKKGKIKFYQRFFFILICFNFLSCNFIKDKIGSYYFNKAKKIAEREEVSEIEIDRFYDYLMKALDYKKDIPKSIDLVEGVTQASLKAGYVKAYENELRFFKKYVEKNPHSWEVYLNIINIFSLKGDLYNLSNLKSDFDRETMKDKNFKILSFIVEVNMLYWVQSYAQISLNNDYDEMIDYLSKYCTYAREIYEIKSESDSGFLNNVSPELIYYFNSTLSDFTTRQNSIKDNCSILEKLNKDQNFQKLVKYTIDGNRHFAKKEYTNAIIYYKAALSIDENFFDARKNLIEAEFQNLLALSLMKRNKDELVDFVYDKTQYLDEMLSEKASRLTNLPFSDNDKFISGVYALKAAMLSVLLDENIGSDKKNKIEKSIRNLLNEAIKYDPANKMAKELISRFASK
ncbi:MAG: hypothetical protein K6357_02935 [Elusimicrobiota bacterium]